MNKNFFSLDSNVGTAHTLVYWNELSNQQKTEILLSSSRHQPDDRVLDLILSEGNPLHIELAFSFLKYAPSIRSRLCDHNQERISRAHEIINNNWVERLGFSPWEVDRFPLRLASDFYSWLKDKSVDGPCADLETWMYKFFTFNQFARKVIIEHGTSLHFMGTVGVLTIGVRRKIVSCDEAADLFISAISASYDENSPRSISWDAGLSWDDATVIASFLSELAVSDRCDEFDNDELLFCPLFKAIRGLPQLIVTEESLEPLQGMHERAISMLERYGNWTPWGNHDLTLLIQHMKLS